MNGILLIIFAIIFCFLYRNRIMKYLKDRWEFVTTINQIPGIDIWSLLKEFLKTTLDSKGKLILTLVEPCYL